MRRSHAKRGLRPAIPDRPRWSGALLRPEDRLVCVELHEEEHAALRARFRADPQVAVHRRDGWEALRALTPYPERRGLIFVDPPFERPGEFERVSAGLALVARRFRGAVQAAWYPVKHRAPVRAFHADIQASGLRDVVAAELWLREPTDPARLNGCGLLVAKPPWGFEAEAGGVLTALESAWARANPARAGRSPGSRRNRMAGGRVCVLGAGAWGTALAIQAARAGAARVSLWARDPVRAAAIEAGRANARHLPGAVLPAAVSVGADARAALAGADFAVLAVPAQHLRAVALASLPPEPPPLVVVAKGVEKGTLKLPLEVVAELRPRTIAAVLSGPNFAHEVAAGLPAAAVVAGSDAALRESAAALLGSPGFQLYGSDDPVGAQVGGAAKNVIAIAAGAVIGAGLGENARAALVTRGLAEISRLAVALGGRSETVAGLSGLGDLLLTAAGPGSRNTSLGLELGRGRTLEEVLADRIGVTEGVATAPAIVSRAETMGVELPVCGAVADLLEGRLTIEAAIARLLARPRRDE